MRRDSSASGHTGVASLPQAFGLGYDENGPLGLPRAVADGRDSSWPTYV